MALRMEELLMFKDLLNVAHEKISEIADEPDLVYYGQAEQEIIDGTYDKGLWAKALVEAKGDEKLRKSEYIVLRAKHLQKQHEEQLLKLREEQIREEQLLTQQIPTGIQYANGLYFYTCCCTHTLEIATNKRTTCQQCGKGYNWVGGTIDIID